MAEAASAHRAAKSTHEETSPQRAGRRRRTSAEPQRAQQGPTAAAVAAPAALDNLSRLQQLADASPLVAQLQRLQALAAGRSAPVAQLAGGPEEEEPDQGQLATAEVPAQLQQAPRVNNTGLPDQLKSGIESLSGLSMDDVRVHYNSSQPAQLNALAYAQGSNIHLAPGQERHLPHEAWHVVQQAQGRVGPTTQANGVAVNDDQGLEQEADAMGGRALQAGDTRRSSEQLPASSPAGAIQAMPVGGALAVMQLMRAKIAVPRPFSLSLANLRLLKTAIDLELKQIRDEINDGFFTEKHQKNVERWLAQYAERIAKLEQLNPGDASFTREQLNPPLTEVQNAMQNVAHLRKVLNTSLEQHTTWKENKELEKAARDEYASYDKKEKQKEPPKKEPQKSPTTAGPVGLGKKWGTLNAALKALEGNTQFCQLVPERAKTISKSIASQDILDAVFHRGKAFWMSARNSDHRLADKSGKVLMIYTFTPSGAKSLMQDYLICGSGDYAEDNEEVWMGETHHPNYTIWKTNEIGSFGVGANRLKALAGDCVKIEQEIEQEK